MALPQPLFKPKSFRELVLYIAARSETHRRFGKVKLHKILWRSDFLAYDELGESITGAEYLKQPMGPWAKQLDPVIDQLVAEKAALVHEQPVPGKRGQQRIIALRPADLSVFTVQQISLVETVIDDLRELTSKQVSDLSHEFIGWKLAHPGEVIPYETVHLMEHEDAAPLTDEDIEAVRRDLKGWPTFPQLNELIRRPTYVAHAAQIRDKHATGTRALELIEYALERNCRLGHLQSLAIDGVKLQVWPVTSAALPLRVLFAGDIERHRVDLFAVHVASPNLGGTGVLRRFSDYFP
jgi:hypothetical protein